MSTKYWDIYVLYIERCVKDNYENDIDPAHYEMEWNHFWPKSIFGDWPVGQYLTLKQHAIATALQTLAFKRNCMFSTHKSYLPPRLLELAWPYFREACRINALKRSKEEMQNHALAITRKLHAEKDENGLSVFAVEKCGSPRKQIVATFPDGSARTFRSVSEAARFFQTKRETVRGYVTNGVPADSDCKFHGVTLKALEQNAISGKVCRRDKANPAKKIKVIYPEGSERIFNSISQTAKNFNVIHQNILKRLKEGPSSRGKLAGLRFELVE